MTNNEIVKYVYNEIDIKEMVSKLIFTSRFDNSIDDLTQYIYITLLEYDNMKLNNLYDKKLLKPWIVRVIFNQRNYYKSVYNEYMKINDRKIEGDILDEIEDGDDKLEFVEYMLSDRYSIYLFSGYTLQDKRKFAALEVYKLYIQRKHTFTTLSKSLKISRGTVNDMLKYSRKIIRDEYKKKYE